MEFLKEIFGEGALTYAQLVEKLKDNKEIKLANLASGEYVGKEKYNSLEEKLQAAEQLAKDTKKQLDDLKAAGDPVQLKADLEAAQNAAREAAEKHAAAMAEKDLNFAVRMAITDAHDAALVAGLLDKTKLKLQEDGKVEGLDDQLKDLRESKAFLFAEKKPDSPPPLNGAKPAPPPTPDKGGKKFSEMSYSERVELKTKNPELYNQLSGGK